MEQPETEEQFIRMICQNTGVSYNEYKAEIDRQLEEIRNMSLDELLELAASLKPIYEDMVKDDKL